MSQHIEMSFGLILQQCNSLTTLSATAQYFKVLN